MRLGCRQLVDSSVGPCEVEVSYSTETDTASRCRSITCAARLHAAIAMAFALPGLSCGYARAGEVEVLHFWTSPGEATSLAQLKSLIAKRGHTWRDFAVVGGAGQNAMSVPPPQPSRDLRYKTGRRKARLPI
jgi:hypothetical protein